MQCTFALDEYDFDLCPLFDAKSSPFDIVIDEETPPTRTKHAYLVSFGNKLGWDGTLPAELQCPRGTNICLTVVNTRPNHPSEPSRILQVIPVAGENLLPKAKMGKIDEGQRHAPLQLTLYGGRYKQQSHKATFFFHCDETALEPSSPSFLWQFNGTHAFSWKSKYACHKPLSTPHPFPLPDPDPPQEPPHDPDSDISDDTRDSSSGMQSLLTLLGIAILIVIMTRLFFSKARRRHWYSPGLPLSSSLLFFKWNKAPFEVGREEVPLTPREDVVIRGDYGSFKD